MKYPIRSRTTWTVASVAFVGVAVLLGTESTPAAEYPTKAQVHMMVDGPPFLPQVKSGKLKALAAAGEKRNPLLPNVPTFAEGGVTGMEVDLWYGIVAPKGTPKAIVAKLNAEINRALGEADLRERFAAMSVEIAGGTPQAFARYIDAESKRWGEVVKAANIKVE